MMRNYARSKVSNGSCGVDVGLVRVTVDRAGNLFLAVAFGDRGVFTINAFGIQIVLFTLADRPADIAATGFSPPAAQL